MRNDNVTPSGSPALVNPMKIGMEAYRICSYSMKSSHNLPAPLRRKETLNVRNQKDQHTEQCRDFNCVINEELYTAANPTI